MLKTTLVNLKDCRCGPVAPQSLYKERPDAVFKWAIECPYCGRSTTWRKSEMSAITAWNDIRSEAIGDTSWKSLTTND